jgi:Kdo2-lipid IVA lauroyltransferase/acyltransferase
MNLISSLLARFFILLFALVPFWMLYLFADLFYLLTYKVFKYRLETVRDNLKKCFPEKSNDELLAIEKLSYKNLAEITVESLKAFTMSKKQIFARHKVINEDDIKHIYENSGGIIALPNHYGNWEWGALSCMQLHFTGIALYKPLANKYLDNYMKNNRSRLGTELVSIYETARCFINNKDKKKNYVMASDQSPSNSKKSYWINFLGRKTAFLHGPESYARKYNYPVVFVDIQRVKRGYYELELSILTDEPQTLEDGKITERLANKLEKVIRKKPQDWLWSHKRWKLTPDS